MPNIWAAIGERAASDWQLRWDELKGSAGLSITAPMSYQNLLKKVPGLAAAIAKETEIRAVEAIGLNVDEGVLRDAESIRHLTVEPLRLCVRSSVEQCANDGARRSPTPHNITRLAMVEIERADRALTAVGVHIAARAEIRKAAILKSAPANALPAQKMSYRAELRSWTLRELLQSAGIFVTIVATIVGGVFLGVSSSRRSCN